MKYSSQGVLLKDSRSLVLDRYWTDNFNKYMHKFKSVKYQVMNMNLSPPHPLNNSMCNNKPVHMCYMSIVTSKTKPFPNMLSVFTKQNPNLIYNIFTHISQNYSIIQPFCFSSAIPLNIYFQNHLYSHQLHAMV